MSNPSVKRDEKEKDGSGTEDSGWTSATGRNVGMIEGGPDSAKKRRESQNKAAPGPEIVAASSTLTAPAPFWASHQSHAPKNDTTAIDVGLVL